VAGGFLTKWTAPAFFYLSVVPVLWWRKRLRLLFAGPHLLAALVAGGLCLGWAALAIRQAGWDVFRDTVGREALLRLSPAHHPRPYPWTEIVTFPLLVLVACLPWSAIALLTLRRGFASLWDERGRRLLGVLQAWAWVNLLFWAVVPGHRPRHGLPLQPALAGLAAFAWIAWQRGLLRWPLRRFSPGAALGAILACWLLVKLVHVHWIVPERSQPREASQRGAELAELVPAEATLYLLGVKDEGILFYYGRPARRIDEPGQLPGESWCLLTARQWRRWPQDRPTALVRDLRDEQGEPLVLVRVTD
jgi:hypothetical protein